MAGAARWLALEVKYLDPVVEFYREHLDVAVARRTDREVALAVGNGAELVLRRPACVPRGGLHTHYALACTTDAYDAWWDRLAGDFDLQEVDFGGMTSLYFDDIEGNCVEIASAADERGDVEGAADERGDVASGDDGRGGDGPTLEGIFEVVFEVEDLADAEEFYTDLGFEVVNRGERRERTRLTNGPLDVELWEPHLGLADARGGVHVDLGFEVPDPSATADAVADRVTRRETVDAGVRVRDPDGHYLTLVDE